MKRSWAILRLFVHCFLRNHREAWEKRSVNDEPPYYWRTYCWDCGKTFHIEGSVEGWKKPEPAQR